MIRQADTQDALRLGRVVTRLSSATVNPPQIPSVTRSSSAATMHSDRTGQREQTDRASSRS